MIDDERTREGLDHLQAAALEAIAATRAFLDVAEELVREPGAVGEIVRTVQAMAATTLRRPDAPPPAPTPADRGADDADDDPSPVRRIHVS
ncbi:MAG TPA: hypothetical protein VMN58_05890 [Acidimicrobiales bacterium]|nr:hypothetical protein [Acidimicrobiales bacterium]